jgi:hypothetical protein
MGAGDSGGPARRVIDAGGPARFGGLSRARYWPARNTIGRDTGRKKSGRFANNTIDKRDTVRAQYKCRPQGRTNKEREKKLWKR